MERSDVRVARSPAPAFALLKPGYLLPARAGEVIE
jgi:hypothetical protein